MKPLGLYIANVVEGRPIWPLRVGAPIERLFYRMSGVDASREMGWKEYTVGVLVFSTLGLVAVYAFQRLQGWLPLNPQQFAAVSPDSSFNTAISFVANTNWQGYSGESTMSYLTQMAALAVQNFVSAAAGIAVVVALIRGAGAARCEDHRQFLGRSHAHHALRAAAAFGGAGAGARVAGRDSEPERVQDGYDGAEHLSGVIGASLFVRRATR